MHDELCKGSNEKLLKMKYENELPPKTSLIQRKNYSKALLTQHQRQRHIEAFGIVTTDHPIVKLTRLLQYRIAVLNSN